MSQQLALFRQFAAGNRPSAAEGKPSVPRSQLAGKVPNRPVGFDF
jgi:hypothetical protein